MVTHLNTELTCHCLIRNLAGTSCIYLTSHQIKFNMKSFYSWGNAHEPRLTHGHHKKYLILSVFPILECLKRQAINSALQNRCCQEKRPPTSKLILFSHPGSMAMPGKFGRNGCLKVWYDYLVLE